MQPKNQISLTRKALYVIMLLGYSFLPSAGKVYLLSMRNPKTTT